jgi:hypothetical protein
MTVAASPESGSPAQADGGGELRLQREVPQVDPVRDEAQPAGEAKLRKFSSGLDAQA